MTVYHATPSDRLIPHRVEPSSSTWDYFLYYVAITFVAGLIGRFAINAALAKTGANMCLYMYREYVIWKYLLVYIYVT